MSDSFVDAADGESDESVSPARPLFFESVEAWLIEWALPHYRRDPKLHKWDPEWWKYEEVGTVLETLWESWEQVRWEDPMTNVVWFRDYFYPIMDRLTDPEDGPFWAYDPPVSAAPPPPFDTKPTPDGWFAAQ